MNATGCVRASGSTLGGTCSSDARLKTDIKTFDLGLNALLGINPKFFKYNGLGEHPASDQLELGVIAQEVEKTAPELVVAKAVKLHTDDKDTTVIKQVNYTSFIYVVINAVKELYHNLMGVKEQQAMQARQIASLQSENEKLKASDVAKEKELEALKLRLEKIENFLNTK